MTRVFYNVFGTVLNQLKLTIISNCKKITFYIVVFAVVLYYFEKTYMEF